MDVGHDQRIVANTGHTFAAGLGAPVDGRTLADRDIVADLYPRHLAIKLQVLRDRPYDGAGEHAAILAHPDILKDGGMREYFAIVAYLDIGVNEGIRPDFYIFAELGVGAHGSERMDFGHDNQFISTACVPPWPPSY